MNKKYRFMKSIKSSLTRKLVAVSLIATLLPLLSWGIFFYTFSMKNVEREYLCSITNNQVQLDYNLSSWINVCQQIAQSYAGDSHLVNFLQYGTEDDYSMVNIVNNSIITRLQTVMAFNRDFYTARLIHGNPEIPLVYDHLYYDPRFNGSWWQDYLKSLGAETGQHTFYVNIKHPEDVYFKLSFEEPKTTDVFSFYYPIYSPYSFNLLLGVFEISIKEDNFFKPLLEQKLAKGVVLEVARSNGDVVYSTNKSFHGITGTEINGKEETSSTKLEGQDYFVVKSYIPGIGCWLIQYTPKVLLYQNNAYRSLILFGLLAVLLTTASISFLVFKILLANLSNLSKTIRQIKNGNLKARAVVKSNDEVGELAREFNEMTQKIGELLEKVEASGKAEKEAIYNALENQISPHFICNALDTVRMTAETQNDRPIADALEMISSYFMYNIYKRTRDVTIVDELKNVTDYLNIHNLIRREKIEYVINVSSELRMSVEEYHILKFSLQPIIENSVKHGFLKKYSKCLIVIEVSRVDSCIRISVEDNGAGMSANDLAALRDILACKTGDDREPKSSGIGLANIRDRFDINYGPGNYMDIDSYEGVGTKVNIVIPAY